MCSFRGSIFVVLSWIACCFCYGQSAEEVYKKSLPSIVSIKAITKDGSVSIGTAFLAFKDGCAVTALHVIDGAIAVTAKFSDGLEFECTGIIDSDKARDLALIKIRSADRPFLTFESTDQPVGSRLFTIGCPRGLEFSITEGILSQIRISNNVKVLQYTAETNPGSSGGPVLTTDSKVIGIVSYKLRDSVGLNFAISSTHAKGLDSSLPTRTWDAINTHSTQEQKIPEKTTPLMDALIKGFHDLKQFSVSLQTSTELVAGDTGQHPSSSFLTTISDLNYDVDLIQRLKGTPNEVFLAEQFMLLVKNCFRCAEILRKYENARRNKELGIEIANAFLVAYSSVRLEPGIIEKSAPGILDSLKTTLGPEIALKLLASQQQKGWIPEQHDQIVRKRFSSGFALLSRLAYDIDETGYVLGIMNSDSNPKMLQFVQRDTAAYALGFRDADIVDSVDGQKCATIAEMKARLLSDWNQEHTVQLTRKSRTFTLKIVVNKVLKTPN